MTLSKHSVLFISLFALALTACGDDDAEPNDEGQQDGGTSGHGGGAGDSGAGIDSGAGGSGPDAGAPTADIEVAGSWTSMWGDEVIDNTMWSGSSLIRYDNAHNEAITQGAPSEDDAGVAIDGTFSKIVWTEPAGDTFYYCFVSFLQPTAAAADANAMPADDSDPDNGGCGDMGFSWTKLERK